MLGQGHFSEGVLPVQGRTPVLVWTGILSGGDWRHPWVSRAHGLQTHAQLSRVADPVRARYQEAFSVGHFLRRRALPFTFSPGLSVSSLPVSTRPQSISLSQTVIALLQKSVSYVLFPHVLGEVCSRTFDPEGADLIFQVA